MVQGENGDDDGEESSTTGTFKRIELKGFNYIIITDNKGSERSFLWLKRVPGSEKFMWGSVKFTGKKFKIKGQEIEVYLPAAKGYYKVKEIIGIEVFIAYKKQMPVLFYLAIIRSHLNGRRKKHTRKS